MSTFDLRAKELAKWRKSARQLAAQMAELEDIAAANDRMLLTLHRLAVLLIKNPKNRRRLAEQLLLKKLSLAHCEWRVFAAPADALAKTAARLPAGGKATDAPLAEKTAGAKAYFYLPLKNGRKTIGLLTLASRDKNAFAGGGAHDLTRRLAELLAAA